MRNLLVPIVLLLVTNFSFGQTTFGLKVYQNTDHFNVSIYNHDSYSTRDVKYLNFDRISLAFTWKQRSIWKQEIEVFIPEISKSIDNVSFPFEYEFREGSGVESEVSTYSIRYEISRRFLHPSKRFNFSLGLGINPYFLKTEYTPTVSNIYASHTEVFGASVNLVPRINFKITDRILLDLNFPFKIYDLSENMRRVNNPAIPQEQQTESRTSNTFFDNVYTVRFGVEFLLNEKAVKQQTARKQM